MKKLLITIGSLLVLAFVVVLFVNASGTKKDLKKSGKADTETVMPCPATCSQSAAQASADCDPAACAGDQDEKCDPATCPEHKKEAAAECAEQTAACPATCSQALK